MHLPLSYFLGVIAYKVRRDSINQRHASRASSGPAERKKHSYDSKGARFGTVYLCIFVEKEGAMYYDIAPAQNVLKKFSKFTRSKNAQPRGKRASQTGTAIGPALSLWALFENGY